VTRPDVVSAMSGATAMLYKLEPLAPRAHAANLPVADAQGFVMRSQSLTRSSLIKTRFRGLQSNVPFLVGVTRTNLPFFTCVST
jgi:hypothetical protein